MWCINPTALCPSINHVHGVGLLMGWPSAHSTSYVEILLRRYVFRCLDHHGPSSLPSFSKVWSLLLCFSLSLRVLSSITSPVSFCSRLWSCDSDEEHCFPFDKFIGDRWQVTDGLHTSSLSIHLGTNHRRLLRLAENCPGVKRWRQGARYSDWSQECPACSWMTRNRTKTLSVHTHAHMHTHCFSMKHRGTWLCFPAFFAYICSGNRH